MKARKAKRYLAVLLAVVMIVGMLPMNAFAAWTTGTMAYSGTQTDKPIKTSVTVGNVTVFKANDESDSYTDDQKTALRQAVWSIPSDENPFGAFPAAAIKSTTGNAISGYTFNPSAKTDASTSYGNVNNWFEPETGTLQYKEGDSFYLAFNIDASKEDLARIYETNPADGQAAKTGKGLTGSFAFFIRYDTDKFEISKDEIFIHPGLTNNLIAYPASNTIPSGSTLSDFDAVDYLSNVTFVKDAAQRTWSTGTYAGTHGCIYVGTDSIASSNCYVAFGETSYEFIVRVTVKSGARPGDANFDIVWDEDAASAKPGIAIGYADNGKVDDDVKCEVNSDFIASTSATVKISGPSITASPVKSGTKTVTVTPDSMPEGLTPSTVNNWKLIVGTGPSAQEKTPSEISGPTNGAYTLTFADNFAAGTDYKLQVGTYESSTFTKVAETELTIIEVPAGKWKVLANNTVSLISTTAKEFVDSDSNSTNDQPIEYCVSASDSTAPAADATGWTDYTAAIAATAFSSTNKYIWIRANGDETNGTASVLTGAIEPNTTPTSDQVKVDYTAEKFKVADGYTYTLTQNGGDAGSETVVSGSAAEVTSSLGTTAGNSTKITVYKKATEGENGTGKLQSGNYEITITRPAAPSITAAADSAQTAKTTGGTVLSGTITGVYAKVVAFGGTAPTTPAGGLTGFAELESTTVDESYADPVENGTDHDKIYLVVPATDTGYVAYGSSKKVASAFKVLDGKGNKFGTITPSADPGDKTIVLTIEGDEFNDPSSDFAIWFTVKDAATNTITLKGAALDTSTTGDVTLTIADSYSEGLEEGTYTVTVDAAAVKQTGGKASPVVKPLEVSGSGYIITIKGTHGGADDVNAVVIPATATVGAGTKTIKAGGELSGAIPAGTAVSVATTLADYAQLDTTSYTATVTDGASVTFADITVAANGNISFTTPAHTFDTANSEKIKITIAINTKVNKKPITYDMLELYKLDTPTTHTAAKDYDGTNDFPTEYGLRVKSGWLSNHDDTNNDNSTDAKTAVKVTGITLDDKDVGTPNVISDKLSGNEIIDVTGPEAGYYSISAASLENAGSAAFHVTINAVPMTGITVTAPNVSKQGEAPTMDEVVAAIKTSPVAVKVGSNVSVSDAVTVGDIIKPGASDADLIDLINAQLTAEGVVSPDPDSTGYSITTNSAGNTTDGTHAYTNATGADQDNCVTTTIAQIHKGDTIAVDTGSTVPTGATFVAVDDPASTIAEISADGVITVISDPTNTPGTFKFKMVEPGVDPNPDTETFFAVTLTEVIAEKTKPDISKLDGSKTFELDVSSLTKTAGEVAGETTGALKNFTKLPQTQVEQPAGSGTMVDVNAPVAFDVTIAKTNRPSRPSGSGITFDGKGFGTPEYETDNADSDGKLSDLPKVRAKKGAMFRGWSTKKDSTKNDVVDLETTTFEEDSTLYAVFVGYIAGYEDGTFKPNRSVTRAELARMLVVASGLYQTGEDYGEPSFTDSKKHWANNEIACAEKAKIVSGVKQSDGTYKFYPDRNITREDAALMIYKAFECKVQKDAADGLTDFSKVSSYAQKFVAALAEIGVINGYEDGSFRPQTNISRAEVTVMIDKFIDMVKSESNAIKTSTDIKSPFKDVKQGDWFYSSVIFGSLNAPESYYAYEFSDPAKYDDTKK